MPQLIVRREGAIGWLVFSNVERHNAVTYEMWSEVPQRIAEFDDDRGIRAVAITGDGEKAFISGADISQFEKQRNSADASAIYNAAVDAAYAAIQAAKKPTLARIRGICMGGGLWVALACDLRIANDAARFGMPAARLSLGLRYENVKRMHEVVPAVHAADILYTGRQFDGREALRMGVVNRSVPDDALDATVAEYLEHLTYSAPLTVMAAKEAARVWRQGEHPAEIERVRTMTAACFDSADYKEGRKAFAEKRKPVFKGK